MLSFSRLVVLLSLLATTSVAAADGPPELHTGAHALIVELKIGGEERELYHDVWIRSEEGRLTLEVRKDPPPIEGGLGSRPRGLCGPQQEQDVSESGDEQPKADDARPMPPSEPKGGLGSKMGGPHEGQEVWLAKGREFTGRIDEEGKLRFGITLVRDDKVVSLHFVGRPNGTGAKGKVRLFTVGQRPVKGTWELYNPGYLIPGFNGAPPF
jgi:hypothetical protein